jgi:Lon protease-like protein
MLEDALKGENYIGMIQPTGDLMRCGTPCVHRIGCAGEIIDSKKTDDGRWFVTLEGRQRFEIADELPGLRGYRVVQADWSLYSDSVGEAPSCDRARLEDALTRYLGRAGLACNEVTLRDCPTAKLITTLPMVCPFSPPEKQALLEAETPSARAAMLISLLEMSAASKTLQ